MGEDGNGVQYIAELGLDISQIPKHLEEIDRLVSQSGVKISELWKKNFNLGDLDIAKGTSAGNFFKQMEQQAASFEKVVGMSRKNAKSVVGDYEYLGNELANYFKQSGQKTAVVWTEEFASHFSESNVRKIFSPYIKWIDEINAKSGDLRPDHLTNELQEMFPELSKHGNAVDLWDNMAEAVGNYQG